MCLVPGLLSSSISRPSERARRLGLYLRWCSFGLILVGLLRLLSFSFWAFLVDASTGLYGLAMYRTSFAERDRPVPIESVLCFALALTFDVSVSALNLASLITHTTLINTLSLAGWQVIFGYVVTGFSFAVFAVGAVIAWLLYRDLRESVLIGAEEGSAFIPRDGQRGGGSGGSFVPVGTILPPTAAFREAQRVDNSARFPGKGYKLEV
jgi:hypothetical protein